MVFSLLAVAAISGQTIRPNLNVSFYDNLIKQVPEKYKRYWEWFFAFSQIPRQSWNHEYAAPAVKKWLLSMGIPESSITIDEAPNVLARIPATPGYENAPTVCLQAHMDVALHNTAEDLPYRVNLENDWFVANETLLGADDGVGIAWMFLTAEERNEFIHGPIELLFTSDEEVGLVGMNYLPGPENITHGLRAKNIINIDFFDSDKFAIASAGSIRFEIIGHRTAEVVDSNEYTEVEFSITDMIGGHSGMNMINGRPTPQEWIARCMSELIENKIDFRIHDYLSGDAANVLPVNGNIRFAVKKDDTEKAKQVISEFFDLLKKQYAQVKLDKATFHIDSRQIPEGYKALTVSDSINFIDSIFGMFHGIMYFVDKAIYTSQNVAKIIVHIDEETDKATITFHVMPRTHIAGHLDYMRRRVASFVRVFKLDETIEHATSKPWNGNASCPLAQTFMGAYRHVTGSEIEPVVFHAGVEAGKFQTRGYDADVINFGADTLNAHTIGESVKLSTTNTKTDVLRAFLQEFAGVAPEPMKPTPEPSQPSSFSPWIAGVIGVVVGALIVGVVWAVFYKSMRKKMLSSMGTALL